MQKFWEHNAMRSPTTPNPPLSQRGEIRLGFRCNARCGFCYYQELLDQPVEKEPSREELLQTLHHLRSLGATEVEFTGGEPTVSLHLKEIIAEAKRIGFINISLITNGLRLANPNYARTLVELGLNDVLLSIHGPDAATHDRHTGIKGSFDKALQAADNLQSLGVRRRATATITGENVSSVKAILSLFLERHFSCIHFAVFSPVAQADQSQSKLYVTYREAGDALTQAITSVATPLPPLSIKYIPFCFLPGLEHHVMNLYQQSFDPDDWNYYYSNRIRRAVKSPLTWLFDSVSLLGMSLVRHKLTALKNGLLGAKVAGFTRLVELARKKHPKACRDCAYYTVCDGVWRGYQQVNPDEQLHPIPGPAVTHPAATYVMSHYRNPGEPLPSIRLNSITPEQPADIKLIQHCQL